MTPPAPVPRLLVVDDEPDLRTLYELTLLREGYEVESAGAVEEAWTRLAAGGFQLLITDMRLPDGSGLDLLARMERHGRPEKAIVITAYASPENAVEALKAGAYDYLTKPVDLRQFRTAVASALGRGPLQRSRDGAAPQATLARMAGESPAMRQVRTMVGKVARSMAPVHISGESGTGKELVARAIHESSPRSAGPFVAVNCGAIPESLLEAEFFGYRKGAFTGAHDDREGFFQAAQGGTLFLDEIGDLPLAMQSKLLRVIQERAVRPLGAVAESPLNVRIVSATHRDLGAEVQAARFRQDLYYRINVIHIAVPPLRHRLDDLPAICAALLGRISADAGVSPAPTITPTALERLAAHAFPGNVRELENLLHRALALSGRQRLEEDDLGLPPLGEPAEDEGDAVASPQAAPAPVPPPASAAAPAARAPLPADLVAHLDEVEREILERALELHRYNRTAAGASLGLSLRQMRYRMARLGIGGPGRDGSPERADADAAS
ncbi:MAG: sigma-54 dependent transcriptional regulator [Rubrivivax sp.]|nr:sigma-54-dependent Fis family transcriptional regulator [Rubrivivax sp.]MCA3258057.1 sigma-54-dependent Fis family transcriptional regulator [Rubrivivax sp.]MCZ8031374.1 sigma-54 dependent transcriptional regulator [Rubrivivax sp.]